MSNAIPLAVYIHWPFCKSKCPYCDFNSHVREGVEQERWKNALLAELDTMASHVRTREVTSIFFGGGTPSLMPPATVEALINRVHALWPVAQDIEITLEANPTSVEAGSFPAFHKAGVNRVSLGVQSLDDAELKFLGRGHSAQEAIRAVGLARDTFSRYSFDLIYARPGQTLAAWERELSQALALAGKHLSLYQLTIEENTAFHHAYHKGGFTLPDEAESEALYRLTEDLLAAHGMAAYEVSNYASPGEESRHNLAYWQGTEYIGVGPGAHGRLVSGQMTVGSGQARLLSTAHCPPSTTSRIATTTLKSPERWLEAVERQGHAVEVWQAIGRETEAEERLMMGLRLRDGIAYNDFMRRHGYDLRDYLSTERTARYRAQGLLSDTQERLQVTLAGRLVLSALTAELLA